MPYAPTIHSIAARQRLTVGALVTALLVAGCGRDSYFCTAIGDSTGLTVELPSIPTGAYTVEVLVRSSSPVSYVYRCDGGPACRNSRAFFPGLVAPYASVRVTTTVGVRTTDYSGINYTDSYPNGPSCAPRSSTATVTAALP